MKPTRTQWFSADKDEPVHVGRYLVKQTGKKPVFRWWNGESWQYNRRKPYSPPAMFGNRPGDAWAGVADRSQSGMPLRSRWTSKHMMEVGRLAA